MKFDVVARFRETIPTVKSVSSSDLEKFWILTEIPFYPFSENLNFSRVLHSPLLKRNFVPKFCTITTNDMHMQRALFHVCKLVI